MLSLLLTLVATPILIPCITRTLEKCVSKILHFIYYCPSILIPTCFYFHPNYSLFMLLFMLLISDKLSLDQISFLNLWSWVHFFLSKKFSLGFLLFWELIICQWKVLWVYYLYIIFSSLVNHYLFAFFFFLVIWLANSLGHNIKSIFFNANV